MGEITGIVMLLIILVVALGWLVPLIWGIVSIRRRKGGVVGIVLAVIGGLWGLFSILFVAFGVFTFLQAMKLASPLAFSAAEYKGATGKILFTHKGTVRLTVIPKGQNRALLISSSNGIAVAPAGELQLVQFEAVAKDKNGVEWTASRQYGLMNRDTISVAANSSPTIKAGGPFTASVNVRRGSGKDEVVIALSFVGEGSDYSIGRTDRGNPPQFRILSLSRQKLFEGTFEYG